MCYNVPLYFERKNIKISDIFYLTRQNPHTIITFSSGESIATTIPIKELMLYLPEEDFLNISKGVVLRKNQIVHISDEGLYTIHLLGMADTVQLGMLIGAAAGMVFCNLIIYILHLFLSFKFGLGLSLFWGVFESLQCILYSNIELKGVARYIPFAWSMNWVQDILSRQIFNYGTEKIWIAALTTGGLLLTLLWFSHWEGRKNYE